MPGRSVSELVNNAILVAERRLRSQMGDAQPAFNMTWNNGGSYGPLRLSGLLEWSRGAMVETTTDAYFAFGPALGRFGALGGIT